MDQFSLHKLLQDVADRACSVDQALTRLRGFPMESLPDACLDHQRHLRTGIPEVIYGAGKSSEQIVAIARAMMAQGGPVLATRVDPEKANVICKILPEFHYHELARMIICQAVPRDDSRYRGTTLVISAGTSDLAVAEEASVTLEALGHPIERIYDTGVAGLHRLLSHHHRLQSAKVIIVAAGMEGALPSVVGGLVHCPVIAVPTSVGYGTSLGGITALFGMLNSCVPGIGVVNIDNGFGAACLAESINRI